MAPEQYKMVFFLLYKIDVNHVFGILSTKISYLSFFV